MGRTPERQAVEDTRHVIVWSALLLALFIVVWHGFAGAMLVRVKHTWLEPAAAPGNLRTEILGRDFFFLISLVVAWIVPFTALVMIAFPSSGSLRGIHITLTVLVLVYFLAIMVIWAIDYHAQNTQTTTNARNLFNDERWCLVNYALAAGTCGNTAGTGLTQAQLGTSVPAAVTFWMLVVFLIFLLVDLLYTWGTWNSVLQSYETSKKDEPEDVETPSAPPKDILAKLSLPQRYAPKRE